MFGISLWIKIKFPSWLLSFEWVTSRRWFAKFGATFNDSSSPMNEWLITTHDSFYYDLSNYYFIWIYYDYYLQKKYIQNILTNIYRENNKKCYKMSGFLSDISRITCQIQMIIRFDKIRPTRVGKWLKIRFNFCH